MEVTKIILFKESVLVYPWTKLKEYSVENFIMYKQSFLKENIKKLK